MRVVLVNEGTYPYVTGGVSTWCDQLVRGLPDVDWDLVAIVGTEPDRPAVELPGNVRSLTAVPIWGPARPVRGRPERAAARLCRGMLGDTAADLVVFPAGLRELAEFARPRPGRFPRARTGRHPLAGVRLGDVLLDAWARARADGIHLPRLTLRDADVAGVLLEHALRPLAAEIPAGADLVHANANGLSSMVALAAKWRAGVPFLMTEHGVYLRERYLAPGDQSPGVKTALLRFHRALARLSYWESDLVTPVSGFNARWAVRHGADPAKLTVIGNGVDPGRFAPLPGEPDEPVISWVGRVDPLKDLETLIRALGVVRAKVPGARLHRAGPRRPGPRPVLRRPAGPPAGTVHRGPRTHLRQRPGPGHPTPTMTAARRGPRPRFTR